MTTPTENQTAIQNFLDSISVERVSALADSVIKSSFEDLLNRLNADAGAVWIVAEGSDEITIAVNVGLRGDTVEGQVSQNLERGMVSKAFRDGQIISDEGLLPHSEKSIDVDCELGQMTVHQVAAPFRLFDKRIGAVTIVQTVTNANTNRKQWGFSENAVESFGRWIEVGQRLFEYEFLKSI